MISGETALSGNEMQALMAAIRHSAHPIAGRPLIA
jgi:hypothetical protein